MTQGSHENFPDWKQQEKDVAEELCADQTVASGSVWYDKTDVTTREHPLDREVQFMADAKSTGFRKFTLHYDFLEENRQRAVKEGKSFLMPIRFELGPDKDDIHDWMLLSKDDFLFVTGLDEVKKFRDDATKTKIAKAEFQKDAVEPLSMLEDLADDPTLTAVQRNVLYKAVDKLEKAIESL
jgi:hypothetical protein